MKYNELINDFLNSLDNNKDIQTVKELKSKLLNDSSFLGELKNYKEDRTINNKKKLYKNSDYVKYLQSETNINILIQEIKHKFNFIKRSCLK